MHMLKIIQKSNYAQELTVLSFAEKMQTGAKNNTNSCGLYYINVQLHKQLGY